MFENLLYIDFSYTLSEVRFSNKKWGCENTYICIYMHI